MSEIKLMQGDYLELMNIILKLQNKELKMDFIRKK